MTGSLLIEAPPNADALVLGSSSKEAGNITVYGDALGHPTLFFDADYPMLLINELGQALSAGAYAVIDIGAGSVFVELVETNQKGYFKMYSSPYLSEVEVFSPHPTKMKFVRFRAPKVGAPFIWLDHGEIPTELQILCQINGIMLDLGTDSYEGGDIRVKRSATANQFYLDADAEENADALTLFGRLLVGTTKPIRLDGSSGDIDLVGQSVLPTAGGLVGYATLKIGGTQYKIALYALA